MLFVCIDKGSLLFGHILSFTSLEGDDEIVVQSLCDGLAYVFHSKDLVPYYGAVNDGDILSCNPAKEGEYTQAFKHFAGREPSVSLLDKKRDAWEYSDIGGGKGFIRGLNQYIEKGWLITTKLSPESVEKQVELIKAWEPKVGDMVFPFNNSQHGWDDYKLGRKSKVMVVENMNNKLYLEHRYHWMVKKSCVFPVWLDAQETAPTTHKAKVPTVNLSVGDTVRIKVGSEVYREGDYLNPIDVYGEVVSIKPKHKWPITVSFGEIKNSYKEKHLEKV